MNKEERPVRKSKKKDKDRPIDIVDYDKFIEGKIFLEELKRRNRPVH